MHTRENARAWRVALVVVGVALVFVAGLAITIYTATAGSGPPLLARGRIAVVPLTGAILQGDGVVRRLREHRRDGSVKGIVLAVESPGGEVAASQAIYRELARMRGEGMPVVAAIGSLGASGAYYASLGADSVLAMPGSLVGSIGVLMTFPDVRVLLEKVGVRFEVVKSAEHKDLGAPYRGLSDDERALLRTVVDDVYQQFVELIVEERGLPRDSVIRIADGRVLSGRGAIRYGLVDRAGDLSEAIEVAGRMAGLGPEPRILRPEERRAGWLDLLTSAVRGLRTKGQGAEVLGGLWSEPLLGDSPRLLYLWR